MYQNSADFVLKHFLMHNGHIIYKDNAIIKEYIWCTAAAHSAIEKNF